MMFPPDLSQYPAKAAGITTAYRQYPQQQLKRGIRVSYPTTWRAYSKWHSSMYGIAPPVCAQTGLMWVTRIMGTQFLIHGAQHGMTANQVHPPPPPSPLPTTHPPPSPPPPSLSSQPPPLSPPPTSQMSSGRSSLNWLITQHHSILRIVLPDRLSFPDKLSTNDAVRGSS
jgi:hypothetical protein